MEKTFPKISVVIPVKNEAAKIRLCIEGILAQTVPVQEIIVIDSGSSDGTVDILKEYSSVTLIEIPGSSFNHGLTRNMGVERASGEFVLLTVGDARPYDEQWIAELLKGFDDEKVAGVCGQQVVPHDRDKNPVEWFRPRSAPVMTKYRFTAAEYEALSPAQKRIICGWDDVTALYRRDILRKIPFQKASYGEDSIWSKEALKAGYAIVYNSAARVYHYHLENKDFTFKRTLTTLYFRYKHFGFIPPAFPNGSAQKLRWVKTIFREKGLSLREKFAWYKYNVDQLAAAREALKIFNEALAQSEANLDEVHEKWCGKPPIPVKASR